MAITFIQTVQTCSRPVNCTRSCHAPGKEAPPPTYLWNYRQAKLSNTLLQCLNRHSVLFTKENTQFVYSVGVFVHCTLTSRCYDPPDLTEKNILDTSVSSVLSIGDVRLAKSTGELLSRPMTVCICIKCLWEDKACMYIYKNVNFSIVNIL